MSDLSRYSWTSPSSRRERAFRPELESTLEKREVLSTVADVAGLLIAPYYARRVPTLHVALSFGNGSRRLAEGTAAQVIVEHSLGNGRWEKVDSGSHSRYFEMEVPNDNATYRVTGRFGPWMDVETVTVRRNWGVARLNFGPR